MQAKIDELETSIGLNSVLANSVASDSTPANKQL